MAKEKLKTIYVCTSCGEQSPRWMGRCPSCGEWNTMVEDVVRQPAGGVKAAKAPVLAGEVRSARLYDIDTNDERSRIVTGISELDRVLGGGIVIGSVILLGGEPGAGKSTLLLQICSSDPRRAAGAVRHRRGVGAPDQAARQPAGRQR